MVGESWWQDVRLAWRRLCRAKGFAGSAVLTLGVGIAGTTVMFSLIEGVLLRPLPVPEPARLLVAWIERPEVGATHWPLPVRDVDVIGTESRTLERVAGVGHTGADPVIAIENATASYINGASVTGDFFSALGVDPLLGRALTRADDVTGAENVLVLAHGLWQRRYGGAYDVLGRRLMLGDRPFTIVGVMPPDVEYPRGVEAWMTVAAATSTLTNPAFRVDIDLVARVRPEVTLEQAASELRSLLARIDAEAPPGAVRDRTPVLRSYPDVVVGDVRTAMLVLFGAVALVLLIASANVANLLLLRGEARKPELAVRAALGAGPGRLTRELLAESVVLAVGAGVIGLAVTSLTLQALAAIVPDGLPRAGSVRIDTGVVLFAASVAFLAAALAGLAPALSAANPDLISELRSGARGATGSASRYGRRALVVAQLEASPHIAAATPVNVEPFSGVGGWELPVFTAEGQTAALAATNPSLNLESIHPNYFETFEVMLVRGRPFTEADRSGAPDVAIVSEDVAARIWPGEDPVGKRIKFGEPDLNSAWRTVVGVARPTRYRELTEARSTLYLPADQFIVAGRMLALRTTSPLPLVAGLARDRVRAVDPDVQVMRVAPFAELLDEPLARPRFNAFLIGLFGGTALLLAAIGLYAVMAAYVRQRYPEIGIRMALGATASDVCRLMLGEGLRLAGLGAALGLAGAAATSRLLRGLLFDIDPLDPVSIVSAALLLVGVSMLACYVPARRATDIDPIATLRAG